VGRGLQGQGARRHRPRQAGGPGYLGSERTTRRAVAAAKKAHRDGRRRIYRPWVPEPGMWFQFDYGQGPVVAGRPTLLFCAWLSWSRCRVVIPVMDKSLPTMGAHRAEIDERDRRAARTEARHEDETNRLTRELDEARTVLAAALARADAADHERLRPRRRLELRPSRWPRGMRPWADCASRWPPPSGQRLGGEAGRAGRGPGRSDPGRAGGRAGPPRRQPGRAPRPIGPAAGPPAERPAGDQERPGKVEAGAGSVALGAAASGDSAPGHESALCLVRDGPGRHSQMPVRSRCRRAMAPGLLA